MPVAEFDEDDAASVAPTEVAPSLSSEEEIAINDEGIAYLNDKFEFLPLKQSQQDIYYDFLMEGAGLFIKTSDLRTIHKDGTGYGRTHEIPVYKRDEEGNRIVDSERRVFRVRVALPPIPRELPVRATFIDGCM